MKFWTTAIIALLAGTCAARAEAGAAPFGGSISSVVYSCADPAACALRCASAPDADDVALAYEEGIVKVAVSDFRLRPHQPPMRCVQVWFRSGLPALHTHLSPTLHCAFGAGFQASSPETPPHLSGR